MGTRRRASLQWKERSGTPLAAQTGKSVFRCAKKTSTRGCFFLRYGMQSALIQSENASPLRPGCPPGRKRARTEGTLQNLPSLDEVPRRSARLAKTAFDLR